MANAALPPGRSRGSIHIFNDWYKNIEILSDQVYKAIVDGSEKAYRGLPSGNVLTIAHPIMQSPLSGAWFDYLDIMTEIIFADGIAA
jgi:hypothetical protein